MHFVNNMKETKVKRLTNFFCQRDFLFPNQRSIPQESFFFPPDAIWLILKDR